MGVPVYRTASTVPQYTDISVYRYTPTSDQHEVQNVLTKHRPENHVSPHKCEVREILLEMLKYSNTKCVLVFFFSIVDSMYTG